MRCSIRLTALSLGALLLAGPASLACGEFGARTSHCAAAETVRSNDTSMPCGCDQMSTACCDMPSAREAMQGSSFEIVQLVDVPEAASLEAVALLAPATLMSHSTSADAFRRHDVGRYTLFSSLLL
jgi:hypothetical protein